MRFSYGAYVTLIATSFAAKALSLPTLGQLAQRLGTRKLLWFGGLGIVPISGLWIISNSFIFLLGVQILAGITWAAYELAMLLLFFETIRPHDRTGMLTAYNFANSLATAAGSILGEFTCSYAAERASRFICCSSGCHPLVVRIALVAIARVSKLNPAGRACRHETARAPNCASIRRRSAVVTDTL